MSYPQYKTTISHLLKGVFSVSVAWLLMVTTVTTVSRAQESHDVEPSNAPIAALTTLDSLKNVSPRTSLSPSIVSMTTSQGVKVLFMPAPEIPMVDVQLTFDAGSARDGSIRPKLYGLASLTARLLDEGTVEHSSNVISQTLESLGSSFGATAYKDMFAVNVRSLTEQSSLTPTLALVQDILRNANFPQSSINRVFDNAQVGQQQQQESPATLAKLRFYKELYGDHPYAQPSVGTGEGLKAITRDDLVAFKQTFLVAQNATIAIVGAVTADQALAMAQQLADSLPNGKMAAAIEPAIALSSDRVVKVPFNSEQTHIVYGKIGIDRSNPRQALAVELANELLGGSDFNALLMQELREKRGLTYGAYSQVVQMRARGPFMLSFSTRNDQAEEAIEVAKKTVANFLAQPTDAQQFDEVKQQFLLSFPSTLAGNSNKLAYMAMMGFYNLPVDYLSSYPKWVNQITLSEAKQAFSAVLQDKNWLLVQVGK